ncbi:MAG: HD domain-containing protein [Acidimicrobiia bacterium]
MSTTSGSGSSGRLPDPGSDDMTHPAVREAIDFAWELHAGQPRKTQEGEPPGPSYLGHVLGVMATVIDSGGTTAQAIAAVLHDAVEDTEVTVDEIRARFGDEVASIVQACSDSETQPKPPWRERKERYVEHLETAEHAAVLVTAADKLNNARAMLRDHAAVGDALWARFNPDADHRWYYTAVLDVVRRRLDNPIVFELEQAVEALREIAPPSPSRKEIPDV